MSIVGAVRNENFGDSRLGSKAAVSKRSMGRPKILQQRPKLNSCSVAAQTPTRPGHPRQRLPRRTRRPRSERRAGIGAAGADQCWTRGRGATKTAAAAYIRRPAFTCVNRPWLSALHSHNGAYGKCARLLLRRNQTAATVTIALYLVAVQNGHKQHCNGRY